METRLLLKIDRPCPRLTEYAEAEPESDDRPRQLLLAPYCWQHLERCIPPWETDPTSEARAQEQWCIARFVIGHYGGTGRAEVHGPCPVESIPPPYQEASEEDYADEADKAYFRYYHIADQAYYVTYQDEQGGARHVCAVWLADWLVWELYEFPNGANTERSHRE